MKKIAFLSLLLASLSGSAQAPKKINYQGLARTATGSPLPGTSITLTISVNNSGGSYSEVQGVTTNSVGLFSFHIGTGGSQVGSLSAITWSINPTNIDVTINDGSGPVVLPTQQLVSVPYALYAETSGTSFTPSLSITQNTISINGGNAVSIASYSAGTGITISGPDALNNYTIASTSAIPSGTIHGQTLFWDNSSSTPGWKIDNNLTNDGSRVGVGIFPNIFKNKLQVVTGSPLDSSAVFAYHFNTVKNEAAMRGFAIGSAAATGSINIDPIMGAQFVGYNTSNGTGVGAVGQGYSPTGDGVGLIAVGSSSSTILGSGRSVGLYASGEGALAPNNFAGVRWW